MALESGSQRSADLGFALFPSGLLDDRLFDCPPFGNDTEAPSLWTEGANTLHPVKVEEESAGPLSARSSQFELQEPLNAFLPHLGNLAADFKMPALQEELANHDSLNSLHNTDTASIETLSRPSRRSARTRKNTCTFADEVSDDYPEESSDTHAAPKKKVGRPITYTGDPDSPLLSDKERKAIKRRMANRESARRARQRKQGIEDSLQGMLKEMAAKEEKMHNHVMAVDRNSQAMYAELQKMHSRLKETEDVGARLQAQMQTVQQQLNAIRAEAKRTSSKPQMPKVIQDLLAREAAMQEHVVSVDDNAHAMFAEMQRMHATVHASWQGCRSLEGQAHVTQQPGMNAN